MMTLTEALNALKSGSCTELGLACQYFEAHPHRDAIPPMVEALKKVSDPDVLVGLKRCLKQLSQTTVSARDPYGVFRL